MKTFGIIEEDFTNYKLPCMFISTTTCTFKCEKEAGIKCCQNSHLINKIPLDISFEMLYNIYINNPITKSIVIGGLEPFDQWKEIFDLINYIRVEKGNDDTIVIYTGYYPEEIEGYIYFLKMFKNIIIKFGRYIPNSNNRYDEILGVTLASDNQFAKKIS